MKDIDFLLAGGEIFALVVYAQLILENARILNINSDLLDHIFDCLVRDMSHFALELHNKPTSTEAQMAQCLKMFRKPVADAKRADRVWLEQVYSQRDAYEMAR
jgi:acyl-CoA dehydrogenase